MGYLSHTKCYLVGPIEHDKTFGKDWREVVSSKLNEFGVHVYNPLDRPEWMAHLEPYMPPAKTREEVLTQIRAHNEESYKYIKTQKFIRHVCMRFVNSCDFVFCYLPNAKTFGSTEELVVAVNAKKPIIFVFPDDVPSLWVYDMATTKEIFTNIKNALVLLNEINDGNVTLDLLQWIFLKDYPKLKLEAEYDW